MKLASRLFFAFCTSQEETGSAFDSKNESTHGTNAVCGKGEGESVEMPLEWSRAPRRGSPDDDLRAVGELSRPEVAVSTRI